MENPVENFLSMMVAEKGASINTIEAYRQDIELFSNWLGSNKLEKASEQDISGFIRELGQKGFAPKTQARRLSALKEFFKFLYSENVIKENPALNLTTPKQEKPLPKFLTHEEVYRLINQAKSAKDIKHRRIAAMLILMYHCGLRVSEMAALPLNSINYNKKQILIKGKGAKERIVPISEEAIAEIKEYLNFRHFFINGKASPWLFPSLTAKEGHITRDFFFKHLKNIAIKAGIYPERVSPHVLRHSFATSLLRNDADLRSVQKMLGHENITTTEIYTHIISDELIAKVQRLHPLNRKKE